MENCTDLHGIAMGSACPSLNRKLRCAKCMWQWWEHMWKSKCKKHHRFVPFLEIKSTCTTLRREERSQVKSGKRKLTVSGRFLNLGCGFARGGRRDGFWTLPKTPKTEKTCKNMRVLWQGQKRWQVWAFSRKLDFRNAQSGRSRC